MRFMTLYKPGRESDAPPAQEEREALGQLIGEMTSAGVLIATEGLHPSAKGARVAVTGSGNFTVTDGPFAETKELIAGYAIIEARDKEHAVELAKRFLAVMGEGQCEIRLMHDAAPCGPELAPEAAEPAEAGAGR
jgi:hypothetical protein